MTPSTRNADQTLAVLDRWVQGEDRLLVLNMHVQDEPQTSDRPALKVVGLMTARSGELRLYRLLGLCGVGRC